MRPKAGMSKQAKGRRLAGAQAHVPWTALWLIPSYFPNDENRDGSRNSLLTVQPPDVARSPRYVYSIQAS